jgi:hypothetical protein
MPGTYEAVVLQSGAAFNPPTATILGIPDDFAWVLEWGALAELLGRESEAIDNERAIYCQKMYQEGLQLMLKTPWIMLGKINGVAVSLDSIEDTDRYSPDFDSNSTGFGPVIVIGGIDFLGGPVRQCQRLIPTLSSVQKPISIPYLILGRRELVLSSAVRNGSLLLP